MIYAFEVTNTGETELTGVSVTDSLPGFEFNENVQIGDVVELVPYDGTLSPGDFVTFMGIYTVTMDDVLAGEVVNTGTVSANGLGDIGITDSDVETTPIDPLVSEIDIDKFLWDINGDPNLSSDISVGDELIYAFEITNTGETELTGVSVTDSLPGFEFNENVQIGDVVELVPYDGTLSPGEFVTFMGTYTVTIDDVLAGEVVNTGTVSSQDIFGDTIGGSDVETTPIDTPVSSVDIDKFLWDINGDPNLSSNIRAGDELIYAFEVTNTGETELTGVSVTDSLPGFEFNENVQIGDVVELVPYDGTLSPGDFVTFMGIYTVTMDDVLAGEVVNTGTVSANGLGDIGITDSDVETTPIDPLVSEIDIDKFLWDINGDPNLHTNIRAGDELIYAFEITNTGETELTGVSVTDSLPGFEFNENVQIGDVVELVPYDGTLSPGDFVTFMGTYTVTMDDVLAGEVVNTGTVSAHDMFGDTVGGSDVETTPIDPLVSSIDIDKMLWDINGDPNLDTDIFVGDELIYGFTVTNTGESTLTGVSVVDSLPGFMMQENVQIGDVVELVEFDGILNPGEFVVFMGSYIVSADDGLAGEVVNTGTVSSIDVYGNSVGDSDVETTPIAPMDVLELDKFLWDINGSPDLHNDIMVGDELIYALEVTNTSDFTVTNVVVSDDTPGVVLDEEVAIPYIAFEQSFVVPDSGDLGVYALVDRTLVSDPEEAKAWDNFTLTQGATVLDAITWAGAYDEGFATGGQTAETDFVIEIAAADGSGLPGSILHSFYVRGGDAGVDDVNVQTTLLSHSGPFGGSAYEYHAMLPFTVLEDGDYFVSITAQQTFPNAAPTIDPSWQWHLGADADGADGFYFYDDLFDDGADVDGTPTPANFEAEKDLAFTWHASELTDFDGTLEAGESATFMARYIVTQEDVTRGFFLNEGSVVGTLPNGETTDDTDTHTVTINPPPVPACNPSNGDIDGDGMVSFSDFLTLSTNFGSSEATASMGDVDCDGQVAFADFLILSNNFGQSVGAEVAAAEVGAADSVDALDAAFADDDSAWAI